MSDAVEVPLAWLLLHALHDEEITRGEAQVSLPRLAKKLNGSVSVLLRELTLLTDAQLGDQQGPGLVKVSQSDGRWMVALTDAGRALMTTSDPSPPSPTPTSAS